MTFRIGTTSYIYPDKLLHNVRKLKGRVDDIELVLFEVKDESNIPSKREKRELARIGEDWNMTYTVHLPLHINLGDADKKKRLGDIDKAVFLINDLLKIDPFAYVLHLNLSAQEQRNIRAWRSRVDDSLQKVASGIACDSRKVVVENLGYPFRLVADLVEKNNFSVCVDIGHLFFTKENIGRHLRKYLPRTRVIHWHGILNGKDHLSLKHAPVSEIKRVVGLLKENTYKGVVTLEIFSLDDLETSMKALEPHL